MCKDCFHAQCNILGAFLNLNKYTPMLVSGFKMAGASPVDLCKSVLNTLYIFITIFGDFFQQNN